MKRDRGLARRARIVPLLALVCAATVVSCSMFGPKGSPQPPSKNLRLKLVAAEKVNRCSGRPGNPVRIRIYLTARDPDLNSPGLTSTWESPGPVFEQVDGKLDQDVLLMPTESKTIRIDAEGNRRFLVVIAGFCETSGSDWYFKGGIDEMKDDEITLELKESSIAPVLKED
jgi:type VI secretion system VasD/TssJ family lipoprotein